MDINVKVTLDTSERFVKTAAMIVALVSGGAHLAVARVKNPTDEGDENRRRFEEVLRKAEAAHASQETPQDAPKDEPEQSPAEEKIDDPEPKDEPAPEASSEEQPQNDPEPEPEEKKDEPAPVTHHSTADLRALCNEKCKALGADDNKMIGKVRNFLKDLLIKHGIKSFNDEIAPELCDDLYDQIESLELSMIA